MKRIIFLSLAAVTAPAIAAPRTSADYAIPLETIESGGRRVTSTDYSMQGSVGGLSGSATAAVAGSLAYSGFVGEIYEPASGYALIASDLTPAETTTTQLIPVQLADDGSGIPISTTTPAYSVVSGPLAGVTAAGLVTTSAVASDTSALVKAVIGGMTYNLTLIVRDTLPDNYGIYAGDLIDDAWQIQYFGLNNPLAGPAKDPDSDGQPNLLEFLAGVIPTDPGSRFLLRIEAVPGLAQQKKLVFSPILAGRDYVVKSSVSPAIGSAWLPLTTSQIQETAGVRSVIDYDASSAKKFYRIEITKP